MSELLDVVGKYLSPDRVEALSQSIGTTPEKTRSAIGALLPTLIAGVARNTAEPNGQEKLHHALEKDHDGAILEHLGAFFGDKPESVPVSERSTAGDSILKHILGGKQERVERGISQSSGLSSGQTMKLMAMVAPMLMGVLGRQRKEQNLSPGGLGQWLSGENEQAEAATGKSSFVARMLDQDGDGDFDLMDVMKFGVKKLFG